MPREAWVLLLPIAWWTFSFLLTRESLRTLLSLDFMRRDGAMFVSLLPMAALAALPLDRERIKSALLLYLGFQAAVAAVGAIGAVSGWDSAFYGRAELVDHQRTFFGLYIAHNATASVYVLLTLGAFTWSLRAGNPRLRTLLLVIAAFLALGCVLARSRGAFLGLGAGLVFAVIHALRSGAPRRVMVAAIACLSIAILAGGGLLFPRFVRMLEQGADRERIDEWYTALKHYERSPYVGIGFGRYNDRLREYTSIGIGTVATKAVVFNDDRHAHNSYLHWAAEGGLIALGVMVLFWMLAVDGLKGRDPLRDWILAAIVAMAVLSLTEHYAGGGAFLVHLGFLIGVHQSGGRRAEVLTPLTVPGFQYGPRSAPEGATG